eukprot:1179746-Prorocentrum_minimum.AAC.2
MQNLNVLISRARVLVGCYYPDRNLGEIGFSVRTGAPRGGGGGRGSDGSGRLLGGGARAAPDGLHAPQ